MEEKIKDVIVLGGGPAGISAAIYSKRAGADVMVIDGGSSALLKAKTIQNYYGFESISGEELISRGIEQYKKLGGEFLRGEVLQIKNDFDAHTYIVELKDKSFKAKAIILALGAGKKKTVDGLQPFENANVSYCAICDGFFFTGRDVCVIGDGEFALSEAEELAKNAKIVYLISKNAPKTQKMSKNIKLMSKNIVGFNGKDMLEEVVFEDETIKVDGAFIALGSLSSFEIAKQLGLLMNGNSIEVDKNQKTNLEGVFACGDCVGGLLQVSKAVGEGAVAGIEAVRYVKMIDGKD